MKIHDFDPVTLSLWPTRVREAVPGLILVLFAITNMSGVDVSNRKSIKIDLTAIAE